MEQNQITDVRHYLEQWPQEIELLRQNRLLRESAFIRFAKDRGIPVSGVVTGDPRDLNKRGWLESDGLDDKGQPLFHPFRIYPLHEILALCKLNIAPSASLQRDRLIGLVEYVVACLPSIEHIEEVARESNKVANLAILLEPVYWPQITSRLSRPSAVSESEFEVLLGDYRRNAPDLVRTLDPTVWSRLHERLRIEAEWMDQNGELYLLLRVANWREREKLKGHVSGSLWIRHIAEVVRRAFEEVHSVRWREEDEAFETWFPGGRQMMFGSSRPLDDELKCRPYLAWNFGLFTGSTVRWYIEGETEYYAVLEVLPEPSKLGIELINLRGNISSERDNAALKLSEWLMQDRHHRRFSIVSFDTDVPANVKTIRRQLQQENVVGSVAAHQPDFEFANFTVEELVEIAARIDEAHGVSGDGVRNANWTSIARGNAFAQKYTETSTRIPRGLKGEEWGRALGRYAVEHPDRPDTKSERPLWREIRAALWARTARYDFQEERFRFDPETFELVDLKENKAR